MKTRIHAEFVIGRLLVAGTTLDTLHDWLRAEAPTWASTIRVWTPDVAVSKSPIAEGRGKLRDLVLSAGTRRGPTYRRLVARYGESSSRILGNAVLKGSNRSLSVYLKFDEELVGRLFGNVISIYTEQSNVEGRPAAEWMKGAFRALCESLGPWWAFACEVDEFDARNIDHVGGQRALGRQPRRHLPGLYWLSFFGGPYVSLIGREALLSSPSPAVAVDAGILLEVYGESHGWQTPQGQDTHRQTLAHLGPEYFFDRDGPDAETVAPPFASLPPDGRHRQH